jgi:hypothetical protein
MVAIEKEVVLAAEPVWALWRGEEGVFGLL